MVNGFVLRTEVPSRTRDVGTISAVARRNKMCRATAAFLTTCLFVALGCVSGAQRAGSTAKSLSPATQPALYFPDRFDWQHKKPEEVGMDAARLDEAVKQVIASENPATKDMGLYLATTFGAHEPF